MALPFTTAFPGPLNTYIPTFGGGGGGTQAKLIVSYARDPKRFAVNKLATRTPTQTLAGNWLTLRPEVLARILNDPNEVVWVDGQPRPTGTHNQQDFRATPYQCIRRSRPAYIGWQTRDQAVWDIQDTQLQVLAHQMMTQRAKAFYDQTMASANHLADHVKTATAWSNIGGTGGFWSAGTVANPIIRRSLLNIGNAIRKSTMDAVSYTDLTLVVTPPAAIAMSNSAEIHDYLARSPYALAQVKGDAPSQNGQWGLPDVIYGMNIVVDGTLRTTSGRLAVPGTTVDMLDADDNKALVIAAPGQLPGNVGQVNTAFSSVHMFVYNGEEMMTETQDETWNKRTLLSVTETYDMKIVAPETCALVTELFV
jgi:hypothetical protein